MKTSSKKIIITVIIIIFVLAIAGTVLGYLFLATDTFKSGKELFSKYIVQNREMLNTLLDSSISTTLDGVKQQNVYESDTIISAVYSEGGEVSNPLNELDIKLKTQKENNYRYRNAQILFEDTEYLGIEGIRDEDIYGIRFPTALRQFLSVRDSENLEQDATRIGIDMNTIEGCMEVINNDQPLVGMVITKEEINSLIDKCLSIISENLNNASFTKQNNVMITYNGNTIKANAYSAFLTSEQVQTMIEQMLNQIKSDEIILRIVGEQNKESFIQEIDNRLENLGIDQEISEITITIYEQDSITLRTVIEAGLENITIENINQDGQNKMNITRQVLNTEQQEQQNLEITKASGDSQESYNIICNIIEGEETYTIEFNINMTSNNGILTTTGNLKFTQGITHVEFSLENTIDTTKIQEKVELDGTNNVILADLDDANLANVMNIVQTQVPGIIQNQADELIEKLQIQDLIENIISNMSGDETGEENQNGETTENPDEDPNGGIESSDGNEPEMSQIEINRFNAKFEFYTGETVSAENVRILVDVVKTNLGDVEIIPVQEPSDNQNTTTDNTNQNTEEETKETIKLIIEKDKENVDLANQVLEKIEDGKKYKVAISYKDSNGMIDYVTIDEITE